jgi:hypothetical protein
MDKRLIGIFVSPEGLIHEIIGGVVKLVTDSQWAHAAVGLEIDGQEVIIEALAPKVGIHPLNKYDNEPNKCVFEIWLTQEQHELMEVEAKRILEGGYWYGLNDCLAGGARDVFGDKVGQEVAEHLCYGFGERTMDCSEVYVRIIRAAFPDFMCGVDANMITPEAAYQATLQYFYHQ